MPPPTHIVTIPYFAFRRFISCSRLGGQLRAGAAQRMPQRDRAAIDIHAVHRIQAQSLDHGQRLRREGFVQFDQVDLVQRQPRQLERLGDGVHRTDPHLLRQASGIGEGHEARQRLRFPAPARAPPTSPPPPPRRPKSATSCPRSPCPWHGRPALSLRQRLQRRIGARPFVHLELDFRLADLRLRVRRGERHRHRHDLLARTCPRPAPPAPSDGWPGRTRPPARA